MTSLQRRVPSGWPGLVGIAALLGGLYVVHSEPAMVASGGFLQDFMYADPRGPETPMSTDDAARNAAAADAAFAALGEAAYGESYWATIVATFDSEAAAAEAAGTLDVPAGGVVLRQGTALIVTPLEHDPEGPPDPIIGRLEAAGADVVVEGDRYGEGAITVDLTCTASSTEEAARIAASIGDYGSVLYYSYARPPWLGPPLTEDEELARSTFRQWATAFADALVADGTLAAYGRRFLAATTAEERERLMAELGDDLADRRMEGLEGELHPGVAALLAAAPTGTDTGVSEEWGLEMGRFMGPLVPDHPDRAPTWFEQRSTASIGGVRAAGSEVDIGWVTFTRFAIGLPALLDYLDRGGCADVRVRLMDFDDVRGD